MTNNNFKVKDHSEAFHKSLTLELVIMAYKKYGIIHIVEDGKVAYIQA